MNLYPIFRALLFQLEPEQAHQLTLRLMQLTGKISPLNSLVRLNYSAPAHPVEAFGLKFCNPLGLAAGYDKDGIAWRGLASLGFGHIEIGTVTPRPQPGNPQPRLFRLPDDEALINRMGFPGRGAEFVLQQISKPRPKSLVLGVNIGKNKDTPVEDAVQDYLHLVRLFSGTADYLAVNVSSPNTVGLRQLQARQELDQLLKQVSLERENSHSKVPILVKLAPDLEDAQLDDALDVILSNRMDGVIATNTTIAREGLHSPFAREPGGLSGRPLFERSLAIVAKIHTRTQRKLPIIAVGGVANATGVQQMMDAGASLVQIYTGLVYAGPGLIKLILQELQSTQVIKNNP